MAKGKPGRAEFLRSGKSDLDPLSRRLLAELTTDPRSSVTALARTLGVSTPTVRDRLRQLEESGVIRGYRVDIDPAAVGLPVSAWVRVRPGPGQLDRVVALARRRPEVSECHRVTGEDCFLLRVHVPDVEDLAPVLDEFLLHGTTTSAIVVSTPVPPRPTLPAPN
ncbi:Lrp/AsnC family transcriptional regulator [Micromonospora sp. WMMD1102]|uniref:Lrp/AsnC family transcriptional regulator n=1 Tax=Micromonospora sp. WMMD1102 TaxID=3016105 RepID=UPI0024158147|nr:Lrp/AsnC family transcriptional regulator [Micromonospora sp. WMMD1102]MDG4788622.1 Lrp/AsnC family transcriptional regulator [Micromonospora sp. WMMD1102]